VVASGLVGSQAGHLLVYQARFGALAPQLQSSGAHAYFPLVAKTGLGVAAALTVGAMLVIGFARMVSRRHLEPQRPARSYLSLLAALYTIQLACFAGQETLEAALTGAPALSAAVLLLWGTLGQLPVAAVIAVALRWLMAEVTSAVQEIRASLGPVELRFDRAPALVPAPAPRREPRLVSNTANRWHGKRGPPSSCVSAP